jgi:hypothetical protein
VDRGESHLLRLGVQIVSNHLGCGFRSEHALEDSPVPLWLGEPLHEHQHTGRGLDFNTRERHHCAWNVT